MGILLQLWVPMIILESSLAKSIWVKSFDILPDNVLNQRIWDWLHWSQTRAVWWVAVCPCTQIPFYSHLQMGDDRSFWSLTKPYLSKCSQEMRRSCHPPRVCSNTLLSQQNMAEELCPKDYHRARLENRDRVWPNPSLSTHFSFLQNWASEWIRTEADICQDVSHS